MAVSDNHQLNCIATGINATKNFSYETLILIFFRLGIETETNKSILSFSVERKFERKQKNDGGLRACLSAYVTRSLKFNEVLKKMKKDN